MLLWETKLKAKQKMMFNCTSHTMTSLLGFCSFPLSFFSQFSSPLYSTPSWLKLGVSAPSFNLATLLYIKNESINWLRVRRKQVEIGWYTEKGFFRKHFSFFTSSYSFFFLLTSGDCLDFRYSAAFRLLHIKPLVNPFF